MTDTPHPVDIHVGERLRLRRKQMGVSQTQLAESAGITFQQVQKYERGFNRISCSRLSDFATTLETTEAWFFQERPDATTPVLNEEQRIAQTLLHSASIGTMIDSLARLPEGTRREAIRALRDVASAFERLNHALIRENLGIVEIKPEQLGEFFAQG